MQDFERNGGEIWDEKMVIYCSSIERENWQAVQGEMAQSS